MGQLEAISAVIGPFTVGPQLLFENAKEIFFNLGVPSTWQWYFQSPKTLLFESGSQSGKV